MVDIEKIQIPQNSQFEREIALELIDLLEVAYDEFDNWIEREEEPNNGITTTTNSYERIATFWGTQFWYLNFGEVKKNQPFGFIVTRQLEDENTGIFVVFRGTRTGPEWWNNFTANREPFDEDTPNLGDIRTGFRRVYSNRERSEQSSIKDILAQKLGDKTKFPDNSRVFVTGHSLGAALATIAALQLISTQGSFSQPELYTFASPRVGDRQFADQVSKLEKSYRITNSEDLVPVLPIAAGRIFNEVWIEEFPTPIKNIIVGIRQTLEGIGNMFNFDPYADYQHIGEPIYFTQQKGNIGDNHNLKTYREATM